MVRSASEELRRTYENIALAMPRPKWRRGGPPDDDHPRPAPHDDRQDPVRLLFALNFSKHLRCVQEFSEAGTAWEEFKIGREFEVPRDTSMDPFRTSLQRARQTLDVTTMLVERREYLAAMANDEIAALNLYSDGSPVRGVEIQGLVMDVLYTNGSKETVVLPGASLSYGHCDAINKTAALLFSLWLLFGPGEKSLRKGAVVGQVPYYRWRYRAPDTELSGLQSSICGAPRRCEHGRVS